MAITIESDRREGWEILVVAGEVDIRTAPELRERLGALLESGVRRLVLDLSAVEFLDSTALSVMVGAHKQLARDGSALAVVCDQDAVLRVLNVTGLARVFAIHPSFDDLLDASDGDSAGGAP